jgi:hypothetical protein
MREGSIDQKPHRVCQHATVGHGCEIIESGNDRLRSRSSDDGIVRDSRCEQPGPTTLAAEL